MHSFSPFHPLDDLRSPLQSLLALLVGGGSQHKKVNLGGWNKNQDFLDFVRQGWARKIQNFLVRKGGGPEKKSGFQEKNPGQKSPEFFFRGGGPEKKIWISGKNPEIQNSGFPEFWRMAFSRILDLDFFQKSRFFFSGPPPPRKKILDFSGLDFSRIPEIFSGPPPPLSNPEILDFSGPPLWIFGAFWGFLGTFWGFFEAKKNKK